MTENTFDKALISDEEWEKVKISRVNTRPNAKSSYGTGSYTASQTKELFDEQGKLFKGKHNKLVGYARAEETARADAEAKRVEAENLRAAAEGSVDENSEYYGGRALAEAQRGEAENKRDQRYTEAEERRDSEYAIAENDRDELYRQAETKRQETFDENETIRQENEDQRIEKDGERDEKIAKIESLVGDLDKGLDAILTTQELIIGGGDS